MKGERERGKDNRDLSAGNKRDSILNEEKFKTPTKL